MYKIIVFLFPFLSFISLAQSLGMIENDGMGRDYFTDAPKITDLQPATWQWQNPSPQGNDLNFIRLSDDKTAIVLGNRGTMMVTKDGGSTWDVQHYVQGSNYLGTAAGFYNSSYGTFLGTNKSLSFTTNGGSTWKSPTRGLPSSVSSSTVFTDVDYFSSTSALVIGYYASVFTPEYYILKTTNGGTNWTSISNALDQYPRSLDIISSTEAVIVGDRGLLAGTTNSGQSWSVGNVGTKNLYGVYFPTTEIGYAVGASGTIYKTTNGGSSWTAQTSGVTSHLYAVHFYNSSYGIIVGSSGTILKTTNGGTDWTSLSSTTTQTLRSVFYRSTGVAMVVGDGGMILRTTNNGTSWSKKVVGTTENLRGLMFVTSSKGYTVGDNGIIRFTTNAGDDWSIQTSNTTNTLYSVDISFSNNNNGLIVGDGGTVLKTSNAGTNWTPMTSGTSNTLRAVDVVSTIAYAVGNSGTVIYSSNYGDSWSLKATGITNNLYGVDFFWSNIGIVVGDAGTILRTTNSGTSWTTITSPVSSTLYAVNMTDYDTTIFAAGSSGKIIKSTNRGLEWTSITSPTTETIYSIFFVDDQKGVFATSSGNIFRTTNGGTSWIQEKSQTANSLFSIQLLLSSGSTGYIACVVGELGQILNCSYGANRVMTWKTTAVDSSWFNSNNWNPSGIPSLGDSVVFPSGAAYYPSFYTTYQQATVGAINILNNGKIYITDSLRRLLIMGDINIVGTFKLRSNATTNIVANGDWLITSAKTKEEQNNLANEGFVPERSTVTFTGTGNVEGNFYNVVFDATSDMTTTGNLTVENNCINNTTVELSSEDTLWIQSSSPNSLSGVGTFPRGTIKRNVGTSTTEEYQFESEDTYIKFNTGSTFPSWISLTTFPDTLPDNFGKVVVVLSSTVDTVNNIITATSVSNFGYWGIGTQYSDGNNVLVKTRVRRVYSGGSSSGSMRNAVSYTLSLRYEQSEVPSGTNEADLKLVEYVDQYVSANAKIFLQGPFSSGTMTTSLNLSGYIPTDQPYDTSPWNYLGDERVESVPSGIVDWVLLELRSNTTTVVDQRAAFLKSDGTVVDLDGTSQVSFPDVLDGSYYLVIYHRNHLPIMSSTTMNLSASSTLYNFTTAQNKAYGTNPMSSLSGGYYGMISGDGNASGNITAYDKNTVWRSQNGLSGYYMADFTLSGSVTSIDANNHWRTNNGKATQVPTSTLEQKNILLNQKTIPDRKTEPQSEKEK
jgi:photosystem II stability/assembly factor-like uncharacterized protein